MLNSNSTSTVKLIRKYLKVKISEDNVRFRGHHKEREHVYDLIMKSILQGESHSALIVGPRGSGKTTLINSVLREVSKEVDMESDVYLVKLNGLLHQDEKVALKSITAQMQLENVVGDRVFGTFAENLSFLLSCMMTGADRRCKTMLFLLEEFHLFCHSGRAQTLLYNLFDITHNKMAPICVLGTTNRLDVTEALEKRVKSRFSHRHICLFPHENTLVLEDVKELFVECLSMPIPRHVKPKRKRMKSVGVEPMDVDDNCIKFSIPDEIFQKCDMDSKQFEELQMDYLESWNAHIQSLASDEKVVDALEKFCYYTFNEQILRNVLFQIVSKLSARKPYIDVTDITEVIDNTVSGESRRRLLQSLSILELSLVIAMMHGMEIFDGQPMNFEMVLHRYTKFSNQNSSTQSVPRPVILKAFEHLQSLEIIQPVRATDAYGADTVSRVQKEFKLYTLTVPVEDIKEAVKGFKALPTEISHWVNNSVV
ncbi:origin recognition complex subunit 4 isoform X1 [Leptidea sinapis]|uniref:origin recognition complex subunit 4 isoform X1 n=2 Tax=Leptidea sinapis TaxID=189913 RepID=UPI0021C44AAC|nr:origin recognition complex subunit 4 isoform X1 [Leptidea sinapis]